MGNEAADFYQSQVLNNSRSPPCPVTLVEKRLFLMEGIRTRGHDPQGRSRSRLADRGLGAHNIMPLSFVQNNVALVAATGILAVVVTVVIFSLGSGGKKKRPSGPLALDPKEYIAFKLIEREELSHDTRRFRFALQSPEHVLGLPIGKHIFLKFTDTDGSPVIRSYTPVSSDDEIGYVDFVIKVYFANVHPKFPEGGKMSQYLEQMKLGDTMLMQGPKGKLTYKGRGVFEIVPKPKVLEVRKAKKVGMIAGGTGITPMLQVIRAILKDPSDKTEMSLIFANQTVDDILLRKELEQIAAEHPKQFKLHYTLDRPPAKWSHSTGFINADMVKEHLPAPGSGTLILMCGPPPMINFACIPAFQKLGYTEEQYFAF